MRSDSVRFFGDSWVNMRFSIIKSLMAMLHSSPAWASSLVHGRVRSCLPRHRRSVVRPKILCAQGENSESVSRRLSEKEARILLGVSEETSFEEIVKAKNRLLLTPNLKNERIQEIERAYDLLLMKSMSRRVEGSDEVPSDVRYADVPKRDLAKEARKIVSKIPTGGIVLESPNNEMLRSNSIVLGVLALSILPQGVNPVTETYDAIPGLQLALAFVWSVYAFRQYKILGLGRSVGYTFVGLLAGGLLGGAIESLLHIQQHPIGAFHSPAAFVSEFAIAGIWTCATFLA